MSICVLNVDKHTQKTKLNNQEIEFVSLYDYQDSKYIDSSKKALLSVRSEWVCLESTTIPFSSSKLVVSDPIKELLGSSFATAICEGVVNKGFVSRFAGTREIFLDRPVYFNRHFLLRNSHLLDKESSLILLLQTADKNGSLLITPSNTTSNSTIKYPRPILSLFKNHLRKTTRLIIAATKRFLRIIVTLPLMTYDHAIKLVTETRFRFKKQTKLAYSDDIPVFIITRDRVDPLKKLVAWIEKEGLKKIIFIDNNSSNPKLLSYLSASKHEVVFLNKNIGHTSPWVESVISIYADDLPFIVTDPDVIPDLTAHGAIREFIRLLNRYPRYHKVGFGLHIDDLPEHYELKDKVINWERQFWEHELEKNVCVAAVDTTFALYRPNTNYILEPALRTTGKFMARHDPWYEDSSRPTADLQYYKEHAAPTSSTWGLGTKDTSHLYV